MLFTSLLLVATCTTAADLQGLQPGYTTMSNKFCSADRQSSSIWHDAADAAACAKQCSSLNAGSGGSGCIMFEWGCHRVKPCLLFNTVAACGDVYTSSCGSNVSRQQLAYTHLNRHTGILYLYILKTYEETLSRGEANLIATIELSVCIHIYIYIPLAINSTSSSFLFVLSFHSSNSCT